VHYDPKTKTEHEIPAKFLDEGEGKLRIVVVEVVVY
jgi:hypothetical protein